MAGRLKAIWLLTQAVIRTFLRLLFGRARAGVAAFHAHYGPDGLPPVTPAERHDLESFGGCIACGLCDRGEGERMAASGGAYRGVMPLVLAASRSMPDFGAAALSLAYVSDEVLSEKEAICPAGVPIRRIAGFIRAKAPRARHSLPPSRP